MPVKKLMATLFILLGFAISVQAETITLKHFTTGSYQQLLKQHQNKPLMLTIWSTTCTSCMEKMPVLQALKNSWQDINIVMLAVDDLSNKIQVQAVLSEHGLADGDNWILADQNAQRVRYEIDPNWFGELPRTYFLNSEHEREGISGALSYDEYQSIFAILLN